MKRLTFRDPLNDGVYPQTDDPSIYQRLCEYEDTGLTPEEIMSLLEERAVKTEEGGR